MVWQAVCGTNPGGTAGQPWGSTPSSTLSQIMELVTPSSVTNKTISSPLSSRSTLQPLSSPYVELLGFSLLFAETDGPPDIGLSRSNRSGIGGVLGRSLSISPGSGWAGGGGLSGKG